jgi:small nuclear ribonucleoprotein (snRNP)-like protein
VTLLLFKIQREYWTTLKSFLLFLNIIRDDELRDVKENQEILKILREL